MGLNDKPCLLIGLGTASILLSATKPEKPGVTNTFVLLEAAVQGQKHRWIFTTTQEKKKGKFNFAGTDKIYATWDSGRNFIWLMIKGSGQMRGVAFESGKSPTFKVSCNYSE